MTVSAVTLLVLLLGGEVLVRATTTRITSSFLALDDTVGRRLVRDVDTVARNTESGRRVHVRTSDVGLRGPTRPETPPPGTRRVVLLGDSMVAALEVEEEETATRLLEDRLTAAGPTPVEVFNGGVPAAGTGQAWLLYRHVLSRFGAQQVVLVFFVGNDLGDNSPRFPRRTRMYWDLDADGGLVPLPFPSLNQRLADWLNRSSRLYVWQREFFADRRGRAHAREERRAAAAVRAAQAATGGPAAAGADSDGAVPPESAAPAEPAGPPTLHGSEWIFCRRPSPDAEHAWGVTRAVLRELRDDCAAHGAELRLLALPCSEQVYPDGFAPVLQRAGELAPHTAPEAADEQLAALCGELGVPFASALPEFRAAAAPTRAAETDPLYYGNVGHLTPRGHATLAAALERALGPSPGSAPDAPGAPGDDR